MKKMDKISTKDERECRKCGEIKPLSDFHADKQQLYKRHIYCKVCRSKARKEYYEKQKIKKRKEFENNANAEILSKTSN